MPIDDPSLCIGGDTFAPCSDSPTEFTSLTSKWQHIHTAYEGATPPTLTDFEPTTRFDGEVNCLDFGYPDHVSPERCRIGTPRNLVWYQDLDICSRHGDSNCVDFFGDPTSSVKQTAGFFWSRVKVGPAPYPRNYTSDRDSVTSGNLRNNYEFVSTPLAALPFMPPITPSPGGGFDGFPIFRKDIASVLGGIFGPIPEPGPIVEQTGGVFVVSDGPFGSFEVTAALSDEVKALLRSGGMQFVGQVEPGFRTQRIGGGLEFVAVPTDWKRSTSRPLPIALSGGGLVVAGPNQGPPNQGPPQPQNLAATASSSPAVTVASSGPPQPTDTAPSDRSNSKWLLSVSEQTLYMIGGDQAGTATGGLWRYSFADRRYPFDEERS